MSNQPELALNDLKVTIPLRERAVALSPDSDEFKRDLAVTYELEAEAFTMLGRGSETVAALVAPEVTLRKLASLESAGVQRRFDLAMCLRRKSDALWSLGRLAESRQTIREAAALCDAVAGKDSNAVYFQVGLITVLNRSAERVGDAASFQRALGIAEAVLKRAPSYVALHAEQARSLCGLGRIAIRREHWEDAQGLLFAGVEAWKNYHRIAPELDPLMDQDTACSNDLARTSSR